MLHFYQIFFHSIIPSLSGLKKLLVTLCSKTLLFVPRCLRARIISEWRDETGRWDNLFLSIFFGLNHSHPKQKLGKNNRNGRHGWMMGSISINSSYLDSVVGTHTCMDYRRVCVWLIFQPRYHHPQEVAKKSCYRKMQRYNLSRSSSSRDMIFLPMRGIKRPS